MAGPDLIVLRHFRRLRSLKAALVAVRELWTGPLLVFVGEEMLTALGAGGPANQLESFLAMLKNLGATAVGLPLRAVPPRTDTCSGPPLPSTAWTNTSERAPVSPT